MREVESFLFHGILVLKMKLGINGLKQSTAISQQCEEASNKPTERATTLYLPPAERQDEAREGQKPAGRDRSRQRAPY